MRAGQRFCPATPERQPGLGSAARHFLQTGGAMSIRPVSRDTAITAINPATGEVLATYDTHTPAEVRAIVEEAQEAFASWRDKTFQDRAAPMRKAAAMLRLNEKEHARLMSLEMGKPIRAAIEEVRKCAWICDYFAENAERMLAREFIWTEAHKSYVALRPIGVVFGVMPWNFPFLQVFRFAAPTLMAGNAAVLKHASNVPGCALAIEKVFRDAGFPKHLCGALMIGSKEVDGIIDNPLIKAVTLTGSGAAGRAVASKAGSLLKKVLLELGGSDPYIVLEDADIEVAAHVCSRGRLVNSGQSCIAAKRMIVVESVRREFEKRFVELMDIAKMGDPLDEHTEVGPLARKDLRDTVHKQVEASVAKGAKVLLGAKIPSRPGWFYPPTVLTDVHRGMPAFDEEVFGPAAAIVPAKDEDEAIAAANDTTYGLGSCVITRDAPRGERIALERMESGLAFVNTVCRSDPRLPFGGVKESGFGRELSAYGIREFVNIKTVYVE
jgi:succinate-semialdehyde dehydrogenase / glutarate-semialdehyde dehydrogenase